MSYLPPIEKNPKPPSYAGWLMEILAVLTGFDGKAGGYSQEEAVSVLAGKREQFKAALIYAYVEETA